MVGGTDRGGGGGGGGMYVVMLVLNEWTIHCCVVFVCGSVIVSKVWKFYL